VHYPVTRSLPTRNQNSNHTFTAEHKINIRPLDAPLNSVENKSMFFWQLKSTSRSRYSDSKKISCQWWVLLFLMRDILIFLKTDQSNFRISFQTE